MDKYFHILILTITFVLASKDMNSSKKIFSNHFQTHYRPLCLYALRYLENTDEAEDVVQDVFTSLWNRKESISEISSIKSYLYTSVKNNCLNKLRKSSQFIDLEDIEVIDDNFEDEKVFRAELEAKLWKMIDELPERQREILLMAKRDGMTYKDIAEATGISVKTVENHVNRAIQTLRKKDFSIYFYFFM